jgi:hypothetical protein
MRRRLALGAALATALVLSLSFTAQAELNRIGDLIVSFQGEITPKKLPRNEAKPVKVRVAGSVKTTNGMRLPQLRTIRVAINRAGVLYDKGLPTCRISSIQPATEEAARRICSGAIVGTGHVTLVVRLPSQGDYVSRNNLLAFNGPVRKGKKTILAQVYSKNPLGAIVLEFTVTKGKGTYGNVIETTLPEYAQGWAYLTQFDMTLGRTYKYRGKQRSFISAACAAPAKFPGAVFPFAKSTYRFSDGESVSTAINRTCGVSRG